MKKSSKIRTCDPGDKDDRPDREQRYCLYSKSGDKLLGRHETIKDAKDQEAAIHARGGSTMKPRLRLAAVPEATIKQLYDPKWAEGIMKAIGGDLNIDSQAAQVLFFTVWNSVIGKMDAALEGMGIDTAEFSKDPTFMQSIAGAAYFVADDAIKGSLGVKSDSLNKAKGHLEALQSVTGKDFEVDTTLKQLKQMSGPIAEKGFDKVMEYLKTVNPEADQKKQPADQKQPAAASVNRFASLLNVVADCIEKYKTTDPEKIFAFIKKHGTKKNSLSDLTLDEVLVGITELKEAANEDHDLIPIQRQEDAYRAPGGYVPAESDDQLVIEDELLYETELGQYPYRDRDSMYGEYYVLIDLDEGQVYGFGESCDEAVENASEASIDHVPIDPSDLGALRCMPCSADFYDVAQGTPYPDFLVEEGVVITPEESESYSEYYETYASIVLEENKNMANKKDKKTAELSDTITVNGIKYVRACDEKEMIEGPDRDHDSAAAVDPKVKQFFQQVAKKSARTARGRSCGCGGPVRDRDSGSELDKVMGNENALKIPSICVESVIGQSWSGGDTVVFEKTDDSWKVNGVDSNGVVDDNLVGIIKSECERIMAEGRQGNTERDADYEEYYENDVEDSSAMVLPFEAYESGKFASNVDELLYGLVVDGHAVTIGDEDYGLFSFVSLGDSTPLIVEYPDGAREVVAAAIIAESDDGSVEVDKFSTTSKAKNEWEYMVELYDEPGVASEKEYSNY